MAVTRDQAKAKWLSLLTEINVLKAKIELLYIPLKDKVVLQVLVDNAVTKAKSHAEALRHSHSLCFYKIGEPGYTKFKQLLATELRKVFEPQEEGSSRRFSILNELESLRRELSLLTVADIVKEELEESISKSITITKSQSEAMRLADNLSQERFGERDDTKFKSLLSRELYILYES